MKEICLSTKGMKRAALLGDQSKFTFVVGKEEREFQCARFQACFVSQKVCDLLSNDPTVDTMRVLPDRECACFDLIERLWNGDSVGVDENNIDELVTVSRELKNDELSQLLIDLHLSTEEISTENCLSRLRVKQSLGMDGSAEIEFIASKLSQFDASVLRSLRVNELRQVLEHGSLTKENENSLLDIILELSKSDDEYYSLLSSIRFESIDQDRIVAVMNAIDPSRIDAGLWGSLTRFVVNKLKDRSV